MGLERGLSLTHDSGFPSLLTPTLFSLLGWPGLRRQLSNEIALCYRLFSLFPRPPDSKE